MFDEPVTNGLWDGLYYMASERVLVNHHEQVGRESLHLPHECTNPPGSGVSDPIKALLSFGSRGRCDEFLHDTQDDLSKQGQSLKEWASNV